MNHDKTKYQWENGFFLDYEKMFDVIMRTTEDSIFFKDRDSKFIYVSDSQLRHLKETDVKKRNR